MPYTIRKQFHFSAAHHLTGLPVGHPCARPHGHNYLVTFELATAALDATGFVRDYGDLDPVKRWLDANLDHRDLNDRYAQPSAELLARELFDRFAPDLRELVAVAVCETPATWAEFRP